METYQEKNLLKEIRNRERMLWVKKFVACLIGVLGISVAITLFRLANMGTDPFSCANLGIADFIGIQFGISQIIINLILFVLLWKIGRSYYGIGTVLNMFLCGYVSDFLMWVLHPLGSPTNMAIRITLMLLGVICCSFGLALYCSAEAGISPYDTLAYAIDEVSKHKLQFRYVRIVADILCVAIGYFLGSTVGIATVIIALCTGPAVQFLRTHWLDRSLWGN